MNTFQLYKNGKISNLFVEKTAFAGVKRVAGTIGKDLFSVTGMTPVQIQTYYEATEEYVIFVGTDGQSPIADMLKENGVIDFSDLKGKRECYLMKVVDSPFSENNHIKKVLVILGSDKRGTIYGMFHLSELCGVSPLIFWGDVIPCKKDSIILSFQEERKTKEPSVKYRGFFINDEWPAFGKWCTKQYGGVNAKAYEQVFELLLRLKGNYLWPAMWNSSFWEDGPGLKNAELADEYGIIIGTSHHEPLCRAGIEWQNQYQQYGKDNTWSFLTNQDAITAFWRDGLRRSKAFENVITIGMRGENDSLLLGENATLQENIDVIKRAIQVQNQLIKEEMKTDVPRMFAIYKEVEDFYFGTEDCEGLSDFDELKDVILLFSDDNYGMLRCIPQENEKPHKGGYGIYYHFDYHGAPYSYEWLNRTNLVKAWEQLTMAYEHGIREMWIVNTGDIKGNEYPLSFFMNLAYDYDRWGISDLKNAEKFTKEWIEMQFALATDEQKEKIQTILDDYTRLTTIRIPESLNEKVYQNNYHEIQRMNQYIKETEEKTKTLREQLPKELLSPYDSMVYYPVMASLNILSLNLAAGMNLELGKRGVLAANEFLPVIAQKVALDQSYVSQFHTFLNGKWNHMMDSAHTGFRGWDDNDWTYPQAQMVYPIPCGKIVISFRGDNSYNLGYHWQDLAPICNEEMMRSDIDRILLDIDSRGNCDFHFTLHCKESWLHFSQTEGNSCLNRQSRTTIEICCDRTQFIGEQKAQIQFDFSFENGQKCRAEAEIKARNGGYKKIPGAFLESEGYICMGAEHFKKKVDINGMGWRIVPRLGRTSDAIKSFPVTKNWIQEKKRPYVEYYFIVREAGSYFLSFFLSPRNPGRKGGELKGAYKINDDEIVLFDTVSNDYFTEWHHKEWSYGVTNNIRMIKEKITLKEGLNTLQFYAGDPNIILEKILIYKQDRPVKITYLAPPESYQIEEK